MANCLSIAIESMNETMCVQIVTFNHICFSQQNYNVSIPVIIYRVGHLLMQNLHFFEIFLTLINSINSVINTIRYKVLFKLLIKNCDLSLIQDNFYKIFSNKQKKSEFKSNNYSISISIICSMKIKNKISKFRFLTLSFPKESKEVLLIFRYFLKFTKLNLDQPKAYRILRFNDHISSCYIPKILPN